MVAWSEDGRLFVKRWTGSFWERLGGGPVSDNARGPATDVGLTATPQGELVVVWAEGPQDRPTQLRVAQWSASAWSFLGEPITTRGKEAVEPRIVSTPPGPVLAWLDRAPGGGPGSPADVRVSRFDGKDWKPVGRSPVSDRARVVGAPALAAPGGVPVVGWVEESGEGRSVQLRRLDVLRDAWTALPAPLGIDGATTEVVLAATADLSLALLANGTGGLGPLQQAAPEASGWLPARLRMLPGPGRDPVLAQNPGGGVVVAWDGEPVVVGLYSSNSFVPVDGRVSGRPGTHAPSAAAAPEAIYVAWREGEPGQLRVNRYEIVEDE